MARHVVHKGGLEWDFSKLHTMPIDPEFERLVRSYLASVLTTDADNRGWKLPETTLIYPWIVRMFPDIHYIHWSRDPRDSILGGHVTDDLADFGIQYEPDGRHPPAPRDKLEIPAGDREVDASSEAHDRSAVRGLRLEPRQRPSRGWRSSWACRLRRSRSGRTRSGGGRPTPKCMTSSFCARTCANSGTRDRPARPSSCKAFSA